MLKLTQTSLDNYPVKVTDINIVSTTIKPINKNKKPTYKLTDYCGKYTNPGYGLKLQKKEIFLSLIIHVINFN